MRNFKSEDALKEMARNMPDIVAERATKYNPFQIWRGMTDAEKTAMFNITYGTLLELNELAAYGMHNPADKDITRLNERRVIDAAEFIFGRFFPTCNTYDSFYIPLNEKLDEWDKESENM